MKKLKLSELNLGNDAEVLTREQLKKVLGGTGGSGQTTIGQTTSDGSDCNMCCWDDYGNDCSACANGTKCEDGSHLSSCAPSMCTA